MRLHTVVGLSTFGKETANLGHNGCYICPVSRRLDDHKTAASSHTNTTGDLRPQRQLRNYAQKTVMSGPRRYRPRTRVKGPLERFEFRYVSPVRYHHHPSLNRKYVLLCLDATTSTSPWSSWRTLSTSFRSSRPDGLNETVRDKSPAEGFTGKGTNSSVAACLLRPQTKCAPVRASSQRLSRIQKKERQRNSSTRHWVVTGCSPQQYSLSISAWRFRITRNTVRGTNRGDEEW